MFRLEHAIAIAALAVILIIGVYNWLSGHWSSESTSWVLAAIAGIAFVASFRGGNCCEHCPGGGKAGGGGPYDLPAGAGDDARRREAAMRRHGRW